MYCRSCRLQTLVGLTVVSYRVPAHTVTISSTAHALQLKINITAIFLISQQMISFTADPAGRSVQGVIPFAWIAGSNPAGVVDVCLLWVLCVVR